MTTFKKGDRVKLNREWGRWAAREDAHPVGRPGVVVGPSRDVEAVRIRFDGNKTSTAFHVSFLSKLRKETI